MLRRQIGSDGPEISQLTFGTMRLVPYLEDCSAEDFLCRLHDDGVDTHHSSFEYDSHLVYLHALSLARKSGRTFQHIVKLAAPSFDSDKFDASRLAREIDRELRELRTEQLACVQWLVRTPDASDQTAHVSIISEQAHLIENAFAELVASGKVGSFVSFPYSVAAATAATSLVGLDGLCVYLNLVETDFVPFLENSSVLALRPLAAGQLVHDPLAAGLRPTLAGPRELVELSLRFPLLHPNVATTITSLRTADQAERSVDAVRATTPDRDEFDQICSTIATPGINHTC